ncbi:hypothetical protein [Pseudosulfitobacter pseudonitzschiae]|uniref:hypothetical protein n=1 Tax=Pseudosulfitobacter pseudonitzschiae TaxID=1402135 RepID=UPI003B80233E
MTNFDLLRSLSAITADVLEFLFLTFLSILVVICEKLSDCLRKWWKTLFTTEG